MISFSQEWIFSPKWCPKNYYDQSRSHFIKCFCFSQSNKAMLYTVLQISTVSERLSVLSRALQTPANFIDEKYNTDTQNLQKYVINTAIFNLLISISYSLIWQSNSSQSLHFQIQYLETVVSSFWQVHEGNSLFHQDPLLLAQPLRCPPELEVRTWGQSCLTQFLISSL